jgi:hypothetical protein
MLKTFKTIMNTSEARRRRALNRQSASATFRRHNERAMKEMFRRLLRKPI